MSLNTQQDRALIEAIQEAFKLSVMPNRSDADREILAEAILQDYRRPDHINIEDLMECL